MSEKVKITAQHVKALLEKKHHDDVFACEAPTNFRGADDYGQIDAFAMKRSWSNFKTQGYEIKVSRSDFVNDDKWPKYMAKCHYFSFVCPTGLIKPSEVSEGVGLYWVAKTGTKLLTKKKPLYRHDADPWTVMMSLLINRTFIDRRQLIHTNDHMLSEHRQELLHAYAQQCEDDKCLGGYLSNFINKKALELAIKHGVKVNDKEDWEMQQLQEDAERWRELKEKSKQIPRVGWMNIHSPEDYVEALTDLSRLPINQQVDNSLKRAEEMVKAARKSFDEHCQRVKENT